jgi:hypothetical protein
MALIPVTILTGFLGSGKTTLLKHILTTNHGKKIAVIENEFGEENIDNEILIQESNEQIVQMSNGCVCCTIRGDLVEALKQLWDQRKSKTIQFERVVIETTGIANPGPVAQTFFMDDDDKFPTICGTGTEDYFCGSYDFDTKKKNEAGVEKTEYTEFSTAYAGLHQVIRGDGHYSVMQRFGMYRWHITDPIRFEKNLKVTTIVLII